MILRSCQDTCLLRGARRSAPPSTTTRDLLRREGRRARRALRFLATTGRTTGSVTSRTPLSAVVDGGQEQLAEARTSGICPSRTNSASCPRKATPHSPANPGAQEVWTGRWSSPPLRHLRRSHRSPHVRDLAMNEIRVIGIIRGELDHLGRVDIVVHDRRIERRTVTLRLPVVRVESADDDSVGA